LMIKIWWALCLPIRSVSVIILIGILDRYEIVASVTVFISFRCCQSAWSRIIMDTFSSLRKLFVSLRNSPLKLCRSSLRSSDNLQVSVAVHFHQKFEIRAPLKIIGRVYTVEVQNSFHFI
jgi:hypothetical protein